MKTNRETVKAQEAPAKAEIRADRFTVPHLREYARELFHVSQSTYDGATAGLTGEHTVEEMRAHIDKWLKEVY